MADSIREKILKQVMTTLAGTTGVSTRIYRTREEPFERNEMPALAVMGGDEAVIQTNLAYLNWQMVLLVEIICNGAVPDSVGDPTRQSIHTKLMTDRTLNGNALNITPTGFRPITLEGDNAPAVLQLSFNVTYRTSVTDLTA